ncbi:MAG: 3'(2'),5'-bisphosphate nucleotidase CysQ [Ignavibacteriaceae bacterium]
MKINPDHLIELALEAGSAILEIYNKTEILIEKKADNSPLTIADKASHSIISEGLKKHYPDIPLLSEEGKNVGFGIRKDWKYFWLIDPLDGTKEFIKKNGEFTVNISLIENKFPVAGLIYAPVLGSVYYADNDHGAFLLLNGSKKELKVNNKKKSLIAVKSKSHSSEEEENFLSSYDISDTISVGSSLKFCMIAEGKADIYFRNGPTWEWDTAAGHAIVNISGGSVRGIGADLTYNKKSLLNSSFLATAKISNEK